MNGITKELRLFQLESHDGTHIEDFHWLVLLCNKSVPQLFAVLRNGLTKVTFEIIILIKQFN